MLSASLHPKTCAMCPREFIPRNSMHTVCSQRCATKMVKRKAQEKETAEKQETKARKAALKRIPDLTKEAQRAFNEFVRLRDFGKPCICCGRPLGNGEVGGGYDCGHYRSTGSAAHLRFDERNAHAQTKQCNRWGAGRAVDYRIGLIARIGLAQVESLESDNTPRKWQRDELIGIRDTYRAKVRELKAMKETA